MTSIVELDNIDDQPLVSQNIRYVNNKIDIATVHLLQQSKSSASQHSESCAPFKCRTGGVCAAWSIPLFLLAIGMWIGTGFIVNRISRSSGDDKWPVALIPMVFGSLLVTCVAMIPWFNLITYNKSRMSQTREGYPA